MLAAITGMDGCENLRKISREKLTVFIDDVKNESNKEIKIIKFANLVDLVDAISKHEHSWFDEQKPLLLLLSETVEEISDTRTTAEFSSVHFQSDQAIEKLHELLLDF